MRYILTAALMGLLWWGVLFLPPGTGRFLQDAGWLAGPALCLASVGTALLLRPLITSEKRQWPSILLGPVVGAILFALLLATGIWIRQGFHSINYQDLFLIMPYWVLLGAAWHFWIVGPMSWLSHRAMRWAARA